MTMINAEKGMILLKGTKTEILSELTCIVYSCVEKIGKDATKKSVELGLSENAIKDAKQDAIKELDTLMEQIKKFKSKVNRLKTKYQIIEVTAVIGENLEELKQRVEANKRCL